MEREQRLADSRHPLSGERGCLRPERGIGKLDDVALGVFERISGTPDGAALDVVTAVDRDPEEPRPDGLATKHGDPDIGAEERLLNDIGRIGRGPKNSECHRVELILVASDKCCKGIAVAAACPLEERLVVHALEGTREVPLRFPAGAGTLSTRPGWRNGRRSGLKNRRGQPREGSTPSPGTLVVNRTPPAAHVGSHSGDERPYTL